MDLRKKTGQPRLLVWLHLCFWLVYYGVHIFIFSNFLPLEIVWIRSLLANVLPLALVFYVNVYLVDRWLERGGWWQYALMAAALVVVVLGLRVQLNLLFPEVDRELVLLSPRDTYRIGALLTNVSILLLSAFYASLLNRYRQAQRQQATIREQQEAQLQFLKAQINPHFLFNTLNNIYSLAVVRSEKTAGMVLQLSNLLRYVIYESQSEQVELEKEVSHIRKFIELFQMRSETPLDIRFGSEGDLQGVQIEPMLLIPLVENCFKHCDFDTNSKAYVRLRLVLREGSLHFDTLNTKNDADRQKDRTGGVGLQNIRRRLELKFPGRFRLETEDRGELFAVRLSFPVNAARSEKPLIAL